MSKPEESIADEMLRAGYERWYRLEEEKAAIGEDLKELFAELKGNGFTPKALRESFRRFRNINDADSQEHDAVVDLYLTSLAGAGRAHTRGASESTTTNTSNSGRDSAKNTAAVTTPEHDADGVFPEPQSETAAQPEPLETTHSDPQWSGAAIPKDAEPKASASPIQPETANETPAITEAPRSSQVTDVGNGGEAGADKSVAASAAAAPSNLTTFIPKPLRPHCQNPGNGCGGMGRKHCFRCEAAIEQSRGGAA